MRTESPANRSGTPVQRNSEDEGVNMKEVDNILGECAVMLGRWALYTRFLAAKTPFEPDEPTKNGVKSSSLTMPQYLSNSNLQKKVSNLLIMPFNTMSTFFFRRSVEKAFQLDEQPEGLTLNINKSIAANAPYITSAVDDVMYIVNQVIQRSLATSQRAVVANVLTTVGRILNSDFIGMIQRKMRDESYPKAAIQGALPPEDKIIAFLVLINNLDVATDYLKRVIAVHVETETEDSANGESPAARLQALFPFSGDAAFVVSTLHTVETTFSAKATELMTDGLNVTFHQVCKPRIRPMLADAFRDASYSGAARRDTSGSSDSESGSGDAVARRFGAAWAQLTRPLRRLLTARAWDKLLAATLPAVAAALEKRLWALAGRVSELGAVALERHVAGVVQAACGDARYGVREAFARCRQIVLVAGMEGEEWEAVLEGRAVEEEGVVWVLDEAERRRARALVADRA